MKKKKKANFSPLPSGRKRKKEKGGMSEKSFFRDYRWKIKRGEKKRREKKRGIERVVV
jgi:hypothetical protein